MIYYKKYKYFQKVQVIMNKKKSKNKKQDKQSEKPVPRKRKRSRQKELVEIQLRTLAMDYWSVLEYHIYTAWILKIKIQAVILIPACHWQIIIDPFSHQNLVQINNSVMEGCSTC